VVLRGSQLYLAASGPVDFFLVAADQTEHYFDPEMAERGLGQGRSTPLSFFQATLQPNDTLIMAVQPAPSWSAETLTGLHGQGPESLRRRLFNQGIPDINAVMVQARPGKGAFYLPKPVKPGQGPAAVEEEEQPGAEQPAVSPALETAAGLTAAAVTAGPAAAEAERAPEPAAAIPAAAAQPPVAASPLAATAAPPAAGPAGDVPAGQPAPARKAAGLAVLGAALSRVFKPLGNGLRKLGLGLRTFLLRMLPGDAFASIPSTVMAFTALAVPVVLVTVSSVVYLRLGRDAQYETFYSQAQQVAERAAGQTDVAAKHADLQTALDLLGKAEAYRVSPEIQALKGQVRYSLDDLELIRRVSYQPAIIGGLPASVKVTRVALIEDELYLLDGNGGSVIRAQLTSQGYEVDLTFQCGPTQSGPVIDIAAWPAGYKPAARLLALDSSGNVLYCQPDEPPKTESLTPPSADAWGQITAFTLDLGDSYALDTLSKGVWIYWRSDFTQEPSMFFNEEIPDLQEVVDITVDRSDLYLLNANNQLTLCFYSDFQGVPTRCSNPKYVDFRPGRENLPLIPPAPFSQIQNTSPPDPALYFLEPSNQAIYHFSLRNLAFQRMLAPENTLAPGSATAFFVDNLKGYLYLAVGNQVFYAVLP
jgi:hypothetical protein